MAAVTGPRLLLAITVAIAAMTIALAVVTGEPGSVIRWTARTSLVLFALAYVARPATQLWPRSGAKVLLRERKWIGDGFAVSHLAHLTGIVWLASPDVGAFVRAQKPSIVIAVAMFLILFAMAITSIDRIRKAMAKRVWLALHRTGMHLAWVVFATSYAPRVSAGAIWMLPIVLLVAIATVRGAAWLRARTAQRARVSVAA